MDALFRCPTSDHIAELRLTLYRDLGLMFFRVWTLFVKSDFSLLRKQEVFGSRAIFRFLEQSQARSRA
jgi:hypothetical protein